MSGSQYQAVQPMRSAATEGHRRVRTRRTTHNSTILAAEGVLFKDTPLGRLPPELLHGLYAATDRNDIPNLRLTCKPLRDVGFEHLWKDIRLRFNSNSFKHVAEISRHRRFGEVVRSLKYHIDSLKRCRPVDVYRAHFPDLDLRTPALDRGTRQGRVLNRLIVRSHGLQPTRRQLDAVERNYFRLVDDQDRLREDRKFASEELAGIIGRLPNLRHVAISNSHNMSRVDLDLDNVYASDNPYPKIAPGLEGPEGLRAAGHLNALLRSFDRAGTKLESFSFGFLDWRIFEDPNQEDWEVALRVIHPLKCIKIRLFLHCHDYLEYFHAISCRELFKQGRPLTLLGSMPSLTNLEVYVKPTNDKNRPHDDIDLTSLFGSHTWPGLRRFAVHRFSTTQNDLLGFFDRHSRSLRVVELTCGEIRQGLWMVVFKTMGRSMKLNDCKLNGLRNPSEDESDQWVEDKYSIARDLALGAWRIPLKDARNALLEASNEYHQGLTLDTT